MRFVLINSVEFGPHQFAAGSIFDDASQARELAAIPDAGGKLIALPNAALEAAAAIAQKRRNKGVPSETLDAIMLAALAAQGGSGFVFPGRVDLSVNCGRVEAPFSATPVLHVQTGGNAGGGFNDLARLGNKSILGYRTANLLALGAWSGFRYTWLNLSPAGGSFEVYANLTVDINGDGSVYKLFVMDPAANPALNTLTVVANPDGSKTATHVAGSHYFLVVDDLAGVVPFVSLGAGWGNHGYRLADVLTVYPAARLREASSGDAGMPRLTPTPAFMLVTGDSLNTRVYTQRLSEVQFNGVVV